MGLNGTTFHLGTEIHYVEVFGLGPLMIVTLRQHTVAATSSKLVCIETAGRNSWVSSTEYCALCSGVIDGGMRWFMDGGVQYKGGQLSSFPSLASAVFPTRPKKPLPALPSAKLW